MLFGFYGLCWTQNLEDIVRQECGDCRAVIIDALEDLDKDLESLYWRTSFLRVIRDHCCQVFETEAVFLFLRGSPIWTVLPAL